jgi:[acyl-carrier-protein] S-malonyltransferase
MSQSLPKALAMFPGQGSQYVGMAKKLFDESPLVRQTFQEASEAISIDLTKLCHQGPEEDLKLTANTQPAILTVSVAMWRLLQERSPVEFGYFAGHSLGEYCALVASNALPFAQAVQLVRKRGEAMQSAVPAGVGAMAAILSCPVDQLETICKKHSGGQESVEAVNYNSPQQTVIAGHKAAVEAAAAEITEAGFRSVMLPVSAPFHSSLMKPARDNMQHAIESATWQNPSTPIVPNITGEVGATYKTSYLIDQINGPVQWSKTIENLIAAEVRQFVEIGPGKVLSGMIKRMVPRGQSTIINFDDFEQGLEQLKALS